MLDSFSKYLHDSFDSVNYKTTVSFEKVLNRVKEYVFIEQKKFKNINVVYDIKVKNFLMPVLTVQPFVEYAIRYGIAKKDNGGTVCISTFEDKENFYVKVTDDGVGLDIAKVNQNDKIFMEFDNIKTRIKIICDGKVEIKSQPGAGTTVIISIPK